MAHSFPSQLKRIAVAVLIVVGLIVAGIAIAISNMRADITDPAVLSNMPVRDLRDSEVETLVRAAFRNAKEVIVQSEGSHANRRPARNVVVKDQRILDTLADSFAIGRDDESLPEYAYPGVMYTQVKFDGPYRPDFVFGGPKEIYVYSGRTVNIKTRFARNIGNLLNLDARSNRKQGQDRQPAGD